MSSEIIVDSPNHKFCWLGRNEAGIEEGRAIAGIENTLATPEAPGLLIGVRGIIDFFVSIQG